MKILITGGSGLVGSNLANKLVEEGHDVVTLDKVDGGFLNQEKVGFYQEDLLNKEFVLDLFEAVEPDAIYHLAANAAEARGQISPVDMTENNLNIFLNVLVAAINNKVKKFIYTSSVAVYGEATVPYKEDGETIPKDVYGVNKLAAEQILKIMAKVYGFEYTIFRPHNIYGPYQSMGDPYRNVVALFMRKVIENQPYTLFGEGTMRRAFSYVEDVVEVLAAALDDKFNDLTVNVGSDKDISIKELSDLIQKITGKTTEVQLAPVRKQEISMFLADHSLQNSLIQYRETPIEEGLKKTWEWVLSQPLPEVIKKENEIAI